MSSKIGLARLDIYIYVCMYIGHIGLQFEEGVETKYFGYKFFKC